MLTLENFNQSSSADKSVIVSMRKDRYIMDRIIYDKYKVELYSIMNFYVEVYRNLTTGKPEQIKGISEDEVIELYFDDNFINAIEFFEKPTYAQN